MNASIVPCEVASKQPNVDMIWPPGKTSIRNRPPLVSSTTFASLWAAPWSTSSAAVQPVDMRHWTFGCAMTLGASTTAATAAATTTPLAVAMNLRRSIISGSSSPLHELVVGALRDAVPRAHQRLELRVGGVHLPGHGGLLRFVLDDFGRELPQITEQRHRSTLFLNSVLRRSSAIAFFRWKS